MKPETCQTTTYKDRFQAQQKDLDQYVMEYLKKEKPELMKEKQK